MDRVWVREGGGRGVLGSGICSVDLTALSWGRVGFERGRPEVLLRTCLQAEACCVQFVRAGTRRSGLKYDLLRGWHIGRSRACAQ